MYYYHHVRHHANSFHHTLRDQQQLVQDRLLPHLQHQISTFVAFEYEAIMRLKSWDEMERIIKASYPRAYQDRNNNGEKQSESCQDSSLWSTLADITLSSEVPINCESLTILHV